MNDDINTYLNTIVKPNGTYKCATLTPLRYGGAKNKAVGVILENIPILRNKRIISPFFGGGSVELVLDSIGYDVVAYDIFQILVDFWECVFTCPKKLALELECLIPSDEHFTKNRHILLNYWNKVKPSDLVYVTKKIIELTDDEKVLLDHDKIIRSAYYYYNMQLSYGPMFLGWKSSIYLNNQEKYNKIVNKIRNFKTNNITISCDSFENVIKNHPTDFLYLDPPYLLGPDSKMFKGIYPNSNFAIHHNSFNHELLRDMLLNHRGGFILTYNNCNTICEWYKSFKHIFPTWQYTFGQGETRVGKNREQDKYIKESHEIIIVCDPML